LDERSEVAVDLAAVKQTALLDKRVVVGLEALRRIGLVQGLVDMSEGRNRHPGYWDLQE